MLLMKILQLVLLFGAAFLLGALLSGLDRIITARIQSRVGPPLLQPLYDVIKLLRKSPIVVNRTQVIYAFSHLAFMMLAVYLLVVGQDYVMLLFVLAFSSIALILGGMSVRSPYSRIGSQREIILMAAYEPILVLSAVGIYLINKSFMIQHIMVSSRPLLFSMPLLFVAFLMAVAIKLHKSPFDIATSHHAHQEIVKGITLEYSGPYLAIIEITHFLEIFLLVALIGLFWATNVYMAIVLETVGFLGIIVVDNAVARLRNFWVMRFMWTVALGLAVVNIIWLYLK